MWKCVVILLVAPLAGCAQGAETPTLGQDEAPPGMLRGVVVDEGIRPLAGARVAIAPGGAVNATDANGVFEFDLEPGTYTVTVSLEGYLNVTVVAGVTQRVNPVVRVVLPADFAAVAYFTEYLFQGFVECAAFPFNWCAQVNIASIIICEGYGVCAGNITTDRSLALHWLDRIPDFLQTEMVWDASFTFGHNFLFVVGGGTQEELASGFATALNSTRGPSPLMLQLDFETLNEHSIGGERAMMTQLHPSPQQEIPGGCVVWNPCGPSVHLMQDYEYFTHTFHGYKPPSDWRFSVHGSPGTP